MYQAGLVLEGGGMKGTYTAGVLDYFLEQNMEFSSVYGVSAGACHACSFLSKQKGRALDVSIDYLDNADYCSIKSLVTTGDLFNVNTCYHLIPEYLNPYDSDTFRSYQGKAYAVVTDIVTGRPAYLRLRDIEEDIDMVRASASLPLVSRTVKINGHLYLDGGMADSIPIQKSILDQNQKNVVILTKEEGFRRKEASKANLALIKLRYFQYPKVYELMKNRHIAYNKTLDFLEQQVENGTAFVIRPKEKSDVGRIEKNVEKLKALYKQGYEDAKENHEALNAYLNS